MTSIFSPMVALASSRSSLTVLPSSSVESSSASESPAFVATAWESTWSARAMKRSPLATKSVSHRTSTRVPSPSPARAVTQAVGRGAALALGDALLALDAQDLLGLGHVAVGLVEGLLDVHHPGRGLLAERLDVSGGVVRHGFLSLFPWVFGGVGQAWALSAASSACSACSGCSACSTCSVGLDLLGRLASTCSAGWASVGSTCSAGWACSVGSTCSAGSAARLDRGRVGGLGHLRGGAVSAASGAVAAAVSPASGAVTSAVCSAWPARSSRSHSASGSSPCASSPAAAWPPPERAMRPSATASAMTRVRRVTERMASSLPGIL